MADFTIFLQGKFDDHCDRFTQCLRTDQDFSWFTSEPNYREKSGDNGIVEIVEVYKKFFGNECPSEFEFGRGGMFMVSANLIKKHSITYYQETLDFFRNYYGDKKWGHYCERFWKLIFEKE